MSTQIVHKTDARVTTVDTGDIVLEQAGIVKLKVGPELVERFERVGNDLQLVLKDGRTITIRNFFIVDEDGNRNDLVLEDADEVLWWGQYTSPWSEFHFTEISIDPAAAALWLDGSAGAALNGWAVAALGVLGAAGLAAMDGGSGSAPRPEPGPLPEPAPQPNREPTAPDYSHAIDEDTSVSGRVSGSDPDGDTLSYRKGDDPAHGTVVVNKDGSYTYTPDPDYNGPDSFTVIVEDGQGGTTTSTVTIDVTPVNDPPAAPDYSHTIDEDTPVSGRVSGSDPDGDTLSYRKGDDPAHGTVVVNKDGSYTYTPDPDYNGPDSFTVIVEDGQGGTTTSTVTIDVTPVNDPPTAPDYSHTIDEDGSASGRVVGSDPEDDTLTYRKGDGPAHGTVVVNPDGSYTYTPDPDYNGEDSFTVIVDDGNGGTTTSTVTIVVDPVNDPVTAADDAYTTAEDTAVVLDLLGNDHAPDGGLAITSINGVALTGGAQSIDVGSGTVEIAADGSMQYVPAPDASGTVTFSYEVRDADGDLDQAQVRIDITPVNDAPVALPPATPLDQVGIDAQTGVDVALDLPSLFEDADGDTLTYSVTGLPDGLSFDPATGRVTGTLGSSASQGGPEGNGVHVVVITATDPSGASATQTFTWIVGNPAPAASDDVVTTAEDTPVFGNVIAGTTTGTGGGGLDSDPDGDPLQVVSFTVGGDPAVHAAGDSVLIPGVGTLVLEANGDYSFTPVPDWNGLVPTVSYTVSDGEGGLASADLVITVSPEDDIADDSATTGQGEAVVIDVGDNDAFSNDDARITAIDGTPIAEGESVAVANGSVTLNADGTLTFTPDAGFSGPTDYTYTVTSGGKTETATVSVVVVDTQVTHGDVHEAGLPSGTDADGSHIATGSLDLPAGWSVVPGSGTTAAGSWEVRADGTYTFTLSGPTKEGELDQVRFDYTIEDGTGQQLTQSVLITIHDDAPTVQLAGASGSLEVDESVLGQAVSHDFSSLFDIDHGADGPQAGPVYGLSLDPAVASGLVDTATGLDVVLVLDGNTITGTAGAGGPIVFTMSIDPATGEVTLVQSRAVEHPDGADADDAVTLASGTVAVTVTATDGDGDSAQATQDIGDLVRFLDDGPSIDASGATPGAVVVDESATGTASDWVDFSGAFEAPDYGADGAGGLAYALEVGASATGLVDTATGQVVVLVDNGGVIEGRVSGSDELVFTIELNGDGEVRLTQMRAVRHPDGEDHDDALALQDGALVLRATATDADGDSATATVEIGGRFQFLDDGPAVIGADDATVHEQYLPTGSEGSADPVVASGTLDVDFGADGAGNIVFTADTVADLEAAGLTAGGHPLTYALSSDGYTLTATAGEGGPAVFTVQITGATGANPGYTFTLHAALDNPDGTDLTPQFLFQATDRDGDHAEGRFTVTVVDDAPEPGSRDIEVDEDGSVTINTSADGSPENTLITEQPQYGSVVVGLDGSITYTPHGNYSGEDSFTYEITADDGNTITITTRVTVNPVADAPDLGADRLVTGDEDTDIGLALTLPVIADAEDLNETAAGDHGERLGAITLTLQDPSGGADSTGAILVKADGTALVSNGSGSYTIVIVTSGTDADPNLHIADGLPTGPTVNYLTQAEYEGLMARTGAEHHGNFRVQVEVTSHEVDDAGVPLTDVDGATSTQIVDVGVQAVTDPVDLQIFDGTAYIDTDEASPLIVQMEEDTSFDLSSLLQVTLGDADGRAGPDTDGSEERWFVITGLPEGSVVNGHVITAAESADGYRIDIPDSYDGDTPTLPALLVTPPQDFSGTLSDITITLNAQDRDADGTTGGMTRGELVSDTVHVELVVAPRAGDVAAGDVATTEDTPVAFLQHVRVTDDGADGAAEIIEAVSFELPPGWVLHLPDTNDGTWSVTGTGAEGDPVVITFTGGDAAAREAVLDAFMVRPPAHSSADATVTVQVTTSDTHPGTGGTHETTVERDITIEVTPVAERTDSDSNDGDGEDVTMTPGHSYATSGAEDTWFKLNSDGFDFTAGWSNEDGNGAANGGPASGSEQTFARLTPFGEDRTTPLEGAWFQYTDSSGKHTVAYNGSPVDIPLEALGTVEFRGPLNFKGEVNIQVQVVTIDTDEDDPSVTDTQVSGEAWLTNLVLDPVADMVTLRVEARVVGQEDSDIALTVQPSSNDPSETFTITIRDIPAGASLSYNGEAVALVDAGDGTYYAQIEDFDPGASLTLTPPPDSNAPIRLQVDAVSVDGNDTSEVATLPIDITVQGVPDTPVFSVENGLSYVEADLDAAGNTVALRDLVTELRSGETSADGSETVTLRISGLGEGFSVVGAGPVVGTPGSAEDRVWVVTADQIESGAVRIQLPPNFSGKVSFTAQPVVTENDNPSELFGIPHNVDFVVTPSPEATLNVSSTVSEDTMGVLDFSAVHRNGDGDESISEVRFRLADGAPAATFYDADGTALVADADGWFVLTGDDIAGVQVLAPANFSGEVPLEVQYRVTDPGDGSVAPVTSELVGTTHTVVVQPVTDAVEVELGSIDVDAGTVNGDAVVLDQPGTITVNLGIAKGADPAAGGATDHDGSETLTHVVITGVPDGVSVVGATFTGDGSWLIVVGEDFNGPIDQAIQFVVDGWAANLPPTPVTITAYTQDGAASSVAGSTTWTLATDFAPGSDGRLPTVTLQAVDTVQAEDQAFSLSDAVSAALDTTGSDQGSYDLTVTLRTAPGDATSFDHPGMTRVEVVEDGVPVVLWTVTVRGVTDETAQQALDQVLDEIQVHAPEHANRNNLAGPLELDVSVTLYNTAVRSGDSLRPTVDIAPATDQAVVDIAAAPADEGQPVAITVNVTSPADRDDWSLVDGRLYLQLGSGLDGDLLYDGSALTQVEVTDVPGLAPGLYYVIDDVQPGTGVSLSFQPSGRFDSGEVTLQAWVQTREDGSDVVLSSGTQTLTVAPVNTPPEVTAQASGTEHDGIDVTRVPIQLTGDLRPDGDEAFASAFIEGLPADFSVYFGADADSAVLANNAGSGTWSIPVSGGDLPGYIAIQAPAHWSGTLPDVILYLVGGEAGAAPTAWPVPVPFSVAPQADGLALSPTLSFGVEGGRIALNLNASLVDARAANGSDAHHERATLELSGFPDGELVRFFVGATELGSDRAVFSNGTWTLTGLTQAELDTLGVIHSGTDGATVTVRAWTQEYDSTGAVGAASDVVEGTLKINVSPQLPTSGDDTLLWTGDAIDGRAGHDVVLLREGSLDGATLAGSLRNIEELDLSSRGPNRIEDLTPEQVREILGVDGTLRITGTADDTLTLSGDWTQGATSDGYVEYTSSSGAALQVSEAMVAGGSSPGAAGTSGGPVLVPFHSPANPLDDLFEQVQMIV